MYDDLLLLYPTVLVGWRQFSTPQFSHSKHLTYTERDKWAPWFAFLFFLFLASSGLFDQLKIIHTHTHAHVSPAHTKHVRTVCTHVHTNTHTQTKTPKCDNIAFRDYSNHRNRETTVSASDSLIYIINIPQLIYSIRNSGCQRHRPNVFKSFTNIWSLISTSDSTQAANWLLPFVISLY